MSETAGRLRAIAAAAAAAAERWALPPVDGPIVGACREAASESGGADQGSQAERTRGYEAGLAAGHAELQRLTAELEGRAKRLDTLIAQAARPLAALDEETFKQLLVLALCIGKQLARRELKANPTEIIGLIRECIGRLPASAREIRVHVHPEDAALVREHLASPAAERAWTLVEDPTQSRGGCLVRTETSQIDARFESRVNGIVSALLGDERSSERPHAEPSAQGAET
ncbi:MAG TPA: flagellar assembly protein FliH [Steroidobacteraceae bacterium]|nr:flagellar assembly protein FliH [Steroidobacteraceae bacterium]